MYKKIIILFFLAFFYFFVAPDVRAKDFATFYKTTYEFNSSGQALVTQEISLVNQTPDLYVSEYSLSLLGGEITQVEAYDKIGALKVKSLVKDKNTIITLTFNEKVVGQNQTLAFILKYRVTGLAKKEGNLWQISLPRIANTGEIDEYHLFLKIPSDYGRIASVNPTPKSQELKGKFTELSFSIDQLKNFGVLILAGQYQTFNFKLSYKLSNPTADKISEKIALPPDTDYQTVFFEKIEPEPLNVEVDQDGNWLAEYELSPKSEIEITAMGQVNIFSLLKKIRTTDFSFKNDYLLAQKYWQVEDPKIQKLASELKTPENVYTYLVTNLTYDYSLVKKSVRRKGALLALDNPQSAVCTEFADLFVTLVRALGIQARELEGFAYSDNPKITALSAENDLLHSWAEYYDAREGRWIMVDPTWGNTTGGIDYFKKFDMSHFVFVIHGSNDSLPFPAGSYKDPQSSERQVFVTLGQEEVTKDKSFDVLKFEPQSLLTLKNNALTVEFKNRSGLAWYNQTLVAQGEQSLAQDHWSITAPPYAKFSISTALTPKESFKDYETPIAFDLGEEPVSLSLKVKSLALRLVLFWGLFFALLLALIIFSLSKRNTLSKSVKSVNLDKG